MIGYFEDIQVGQQTQLGNHTFTSDEITRFARKYDPQSFHMDADKAKDSHFGQLVASGWHTAAVWMKLMVTTHRDALRRSHPLNPDEPMKFGPSPGFTDLKWHRPVYVNDTISYTSRVTSKRLLSSRPTWGLVESQNEGINQDGTLVFSFKGKIFMARNV